MRVRGRGTKGRKIRAAIAALPVGASAAEVCAHAKLPAKNQPYVYAVRQAMKKEGLKKEGLKKAAEKHAGGHTGGHGESAAEAFVKGKRRVGPKHISKVLGEVAASDLLTLHPTVQQLGGCQRAKEALAALEELQKV